MGLHTRPGPTPDEECLVESVRACFSRKAASCWFAVIRVGVAVRGHERGLSRIVGRHEVSPTWCTGRWN